MGGQPHAVATRHREPSHLRSDTSRADTANCRHACPNRLEQDGIPLGATRSLLPGVARSLYPFLDPEQHAAFHDETDGLDQSPQHPLSAWTGVALAAHKPVGCPAPAGTPPQPPRAAVDAPHRRGDTRTCCRVPATHDPASARRLPHPPPRTAPRAAQRHPPRGTRSASPRTPSLPSWRPGPRDDLDAGRS